MNGKKETYIIYKDVQLKNNHEEISQELQIKVTDRKRTRTEVEREREITILDSLFDQARCDGCLALTQ